MPPPQGISVNDRASSFRRDPGHEMTLDDWTNQLPDGHAAKVQLMMMRNHAERQDEEILRLRNEFMSSTPEQNQQQPSDPFVAERQPIGHAPMEEQQRLLEAQHAEKAAAEKAVTDAGIVADKELRRDLDAQLQKLKSLPGSRERNLSITKLQECIMWLGMDLKRLNDTRPYPSSYDPSNTKVEPTADNLKL
jgi:hypothetical protein